MKNDHKKSVIHAGLNLLTQEDSFAFASEHVELLMAVENFGSISKAAKEVGISYKTAWDRIENINNMTDSPFVQRQAGGAAGGGTTLTEHGRKMIAGFMELQREHQDFLLSLNKKISSLKDVSNFIRGIEMKSSARNQFQGTVSAVNSGVVNTEVVIKISNSQSICAIITEESRRNLKLAVGSSAIALIKSSWIILSHQTSLETSARNNFTGKVTRLTPGQINSEVVLDLGEQKTLCAVVTNESVEQLKLSEGSKASAFFKASNVILTC